MKDSKKKIKILQFPIANSNGGITHYAVDNWKLMNKDMFQCDFATMSKHLDFEEELTAMGSKVHYISCYAEADSEQFAKEVHKILDEGYDVVHLHTKQWKSFLLEEICQKRGVPKVIVHSHSTRCDNNDELKRKEETENHYQVRNSFHEGLATDFWACSTEAAEWLYGEQIPKDKIRIMKNAINIETFLYNGEKRNQLRKELNLEDKFVLANVGRMVYQKNQSFLLKVFQCVHKRLPNAILLLIGDGELKEQLMAQAHELGIEKDVFFLGKRTDVADWYQAMDLFLLPSNFEGLPITLIEAQTSGLRCICSEGISKESDISGLVEFMPLKLEKWAETILENSQEYGRMDMYAEVTNAGYNIQNQIKVIEMEYCSVTKIEIESSNGKR